MRLPATLSSFLYLLISQQQYVSAGPLAPLEELKADVDWIRHIFDRQAPCAGTVCGMSSQYCCDAGSTCYTDVNTIARCAAATAQRQNGGWSYVTVTMVMTDLLTVVSTYSTFVGAPATTTQDLILSTAICNANQQGCGAICCDNGVETCVASGSCSQLGQPTTVASAPLRPTSGGTTTFTAVIPATTTQAFIPPVSAAATSAVVVASTTGGSGLSGGAIAGIVIGVLAGIVILIAICFCCIIKAGWDVFLGLLGVRNRSRSRERTEVIEERYSRHGSGAASRRDEHKGWFGGGGGGRSTRVTEKKKSGFLSGEGGALAGIALGLAGLWALLGLRRSQKAKKARSEVSYETYSESFSGTHSSDSSASSDRRTRDTRRTRETRETRRVTSRTR